MSTIPELYADALLNFEKLVQIWMSGSPGFSRLDICRGSRILPGTL